MGSSIPVVILDLAVARMVGQRPMCSPKDIQRMHNFNARGWRILQLVRRTFPCRSAAKMLSYLKNIMCAAIIREFTNG